MNRSVWFPGDLASRVEAEARSQDRSFNWVVVRALESALSGVEGRSLQSGGRGRDVGSPPRRGDASSDGAPDSSASSRAPEDFEKLKQMDQELGSIKVPPEDWEPPPKPEDVPGVQKGVKAGRDLMWERQRRLNERKS
jgi:hypothetical protein